MKIYRAVFEYNNADTCEWERWIKETSSWYLNKETAEKHIPILEKFRDYLLDYYSSDWAFNCNEPFIEEQEIAEEFIPINLETKDFKPFIGFEYIEYNGPLEITSREIRVRFPGGLDGFYVQIGDECFSISSKGGIYKEKHENSSYYKYSLEIREKLIKICSDYYESVRSVCEEFTKEYDSLDNWPDLELEDPKRREGYESQRKCEVEYVIKLLSQDYRLKLTDCSIKELKDELNNWRGKEYPGYRESLLKLLEITE